MIGIIADESVAVQRRTAFGAQPVAVFERGVADFCAEPVDAVVSVTVSVRAALGTPVVAFDGLIGTDVETDVAGDVADVTVAV